MNNIIIIISDGIKTSLIVNGERLNSVTKMSFSHVAGEDVELNIKVGFSRPSVPISRALYSEARKELWGEDTQANNDI